MRNPQRRSGKFIDGVHHIDFPVYYEDTDAGGVVYYANYLRFAERGRTEALQLAGIDHVELMEKYGIWFVARRCVIDYLKPGRLDDLLVVRTSIREMRNTSLLMRQEIGKYVYSTAQNGEAAEENTPPRIEDIAVIDAFMVCVNTAVKPNKIPEPVREAMLAHLPVHNTTTTR
ncbi:MAG: YbgC/FadM family acyl-CoA thioesterase [Alphaproteobacteria bacterium]|nr:YbgC/FadM family acyl-CoA thioesterase [Alphaproteobacteria bacterium]